MFNEYVPLDEYDLVGAEGGLFSAIGGAIKGAVGGLLTGGPTGALLGAGAGLVGSLGGEAEEEASHGTLGLPNPFANPPDCPPPLVRDSDGECRHPGSPADISVGGSMGGVQTKGYFGRAVAPMTMSGVRRRCPKPLVLAVDNLCYRKSELRKGERKWPPGRKPLFTGGDLNAIDRAAKLEDKAKDIAQKLGWSVRSKSAAARAAMEKKYVRGSSSHAMRALTPGVQVIDTD